MQKGGKITLHFVDPGGAISGKLLPTGNATDVVTILGSKIADQFVLRVTHGPHGRQVRLAVRVPAQGAFEACAVAGVQQFPRRRVVGG